MGVAACSKYETVKNDPLRTKIYTLDNGLKVYMSVNKEEPRIQTYIAVKVGAKNDPSETTGLAHYFEHLMFKGTPHFGTTDYEAEKPLLDEIEALFETYRKTADPAAREAIYHRIDSVSYEASKISIPNEYDKLMAMIGARGTNAWTSHDETVYTEDIPSNQIDNWARIQADRFRNTVIRGFHTELETIYEEKNMSLTQDSRKLWAALDEAMFPHHPYGTQTVLGTQEHLKNPSITNVKKYHDQYYVPNNIAICVAGDFNPKEMVAIIEKYFGDWQPNPDIPVLHFEKEAPITAPIEREVYGLEAEDIVIGWPLPGASDLKNSAVAEIAGSILSNGTAGLMDLDLNQQQKVLGSQAGVQTQPDYSQFIALGVPKDGQTLEEVRELLLAEVAKLRSGDFDEGLIAATVNNLRLDKMQQLEHNASRASAYVSAFINGIDWKDAALELDRYASVTKEDVVAWAGQYLPENGYAVVYKRQGEDKSVQKIAAPKITPIVTNRDLQSEFLTQIQNTSVMPIDPVFVDFSKDMSTLEIAPGIDALYKKNGLNDIFNLRFEVKTGVEEDPALGFAFDYLQYLGTADMTPEQLASRMYELACNFSFNCGPNRTVISLSGLDENRDEALRLLEDLLVNATPNEAALQNLKMDMMKSRMDAKTSQRACFSALQRFIMYGGDYIQSITLPNEEMLSLTSGDLLEKVRHLFDYEHRVLYYGPSSSSVLKSALLANHLVGTGLKPLEDVYPTRLVTKEDKVVLAQYDAKQLYYLQYSDRGEVFDPSVNPEIALYNEYFGGGMNSIVFQEMREARGLAYSASAYLSTPSHKADTYPFIAFIATQNDKMQHAVEAFDEIIEDMPESEAAFAIAKDGILSRLRTARTTGFGVLSAYERCEMLGIEHPLDKELFEKVQDMSLQDVKATQEKWVKDRDYTYAILGDLKDIDLKYLSSLGPVQVVSLEELFGY
ncbi:MAG: insulinase family protein [Bacteroidales bacterium]|nr:insulinase family protein [Bacteroidales bacterium]